MKELFQILLVEDNPGDTFLIQKQLKTTKTFRCHLVQVESLEQVSAALKQNSFDVILLDLSLPDSSGLETLKSIEARALGIPIVILTGLNDEDLAIQAVREGAQDYLVKGQVRGDILVQSLRYAIERKHRVLVEMRNQELDNARIEAEKVSQLKSSFLATLSHELRTPLASILNYLKLLKEKFYDNEEELAEYLEFAHLSAENLNNIIDEVLDIAKIEAGKMEVDLEIIELEPLLIEQLNLFKPDTIKKDIKLIVDCQVKKVYADRLKLKQVLTNLLNNAFKFTQQGEILLKAIPKTETTTSGEKTRVEISVLDTGIGIEPERQATIFGAFVQEDSSIRRRYGGTGLGLAICKQLVELMEGKITLSSKGRNLGTQVVIILPGVEK